jgi:adenosylhomocysteine nucleosidase
LIDIVTALHCEAKPLITKFNLKKDTASTKFDLFRSSDVSLIVSGMGKIRSAAATTFLLHTGGVPEAVVNIGICGSANAHWKLGSLFVINKVTDHASGREFYPDLVYKFGLEESAVETFDKPVVMENISGMDLGLVDMEASGFFQSASLFLESHRIVCLKIISDFLELSNISKDFISGLIGKNVPSIEKVLSVLKRAYRPAPALSHAEQEWLGKIRKQLRLTETQHHQLVDWAKSYKVRNHAGLDVLETFLTLEIKTKNDNKLAFSRIRQILIQ